MKKAFHVEDLRFKYSSSDVDTIKGISFNVFEGEIFGFLGPSGAGKSTTQKILIKLLEDYQGSIKYFGHTLSTIAVTPVGAGGYIRFKMAYIYLMSVLSNIVVLLGTKVLAGEHYSIGGVSLFDNLSLAHIISYALISALFAPTLALLQAAFAKNEVEGFAFIKGTGIVAPLPALLVLQTFYGAKQYLLGVFPNFWPTKAVMLKLFPIPASANLSYPLYLIIGGIYSLLILIAAYRFFLKRTQY